MSEDLSYLNVIPKGTRVVKVYRGKLLNKGTVISQRDDRVAVRWDAYVNKRSQIGWSNYKTLRIIGESQK